MARSSGRDSWHRGGRCVLALALLLFGCATPLASQRWMRAETEHFSIISSAPAEETAEIARGLERFRAAVIEITELEDIRPRLPTLVYLFGDEAQFRRFQLRRGVEGFMAPRGHRNFLVVNAENPRALEVSYHEYVHFVLSNESSLRFPAWYHEGFAEMLSTVAVSGDRVEIGGVPPARIPWLLYGNTLSLRRILGASDVLNWSNRALSMFYAQSWAFTHFLHHSAAVGFEDRFDGMVEYLRLAHRGQELDGAVRAAFGLSVEELEREFLSYVSAGRIPYGSMPLSRLSYPTDVSLSPLDDTEKLYLLADLALALGEKWEDRAERLLRSAVSRDPEHVEALAALGRLLVARAPSEAWPLLQRSLELGPDDAAALRMYADALVERAGTSRSVVESRELLERAVSHYQRSLEVEPDQASAHMGLARARGASGDRDGAIEALEAARSRAPGLAPLAVELAEHYLARGEAAKSRDLLRHVTAQGHGNGIEALDLHRLEGLQARAGVGPTVPRSTRHLEARLDCEAPEPGAEVRGLAGWTEVRGRGGMWEAEMLEVVMAIDESNSTLRASGRDLDQDGVVGSNRKWGARARVSTDPGDAIILAELQAARALLNQLDPETSRVSLVTFSRDARLRAGLGPPEAALDALDQYEVYFDPTGTSLARPLRASLLAFGERDAAERSQRTILLLSDGQPTVPNRRTGRAQALEAAEQLADLGIPVHAYALGEEAVGESETYRRIAELTGGRFVPVLDPADVVNALAEIRFTGLEQIQLRNATTGETGRAIRVFADGSFDGFISLAQGRNELEIQAIMVDGRVVAEHRTVFYERPQSPTQGDLEEVEQLRATLRERTLETELARRASHPHPEERPRTLEVEIE